MNPDPFQQAWKAESAQTRVAIDVDSLSKEVQRSQQGFQSMIFWRDVREAGISLLLIPVWFVMGFAMSLPWTWYLTVPALIWVAAFFVVDRRRHPQRASEPGEPLGFYAKESLVQVEHQIWLLRNILWWYLLPLGMPVLAFFLHVSWRSSTGRWEFALAAISWGLFMLVIDGVIYWLNQYAMRKQLEPRREDLLKLVTSLESDTNSEDSGDLMELVAALADPARSGGVSWQGWAENWNRIIPSWGAAAWIVLPTLVGACCGLYSGLWIHLPEMGPTFFQVVVGAVIPFEIALGYVWLQSKKMQKLNTTGPTAEVDHLANPTVRRTPKAPAMFIVVLTLGLGVLAVLAVLAFAIEFNNASVPGLGLHDVAPFDEGEIANLDGWPKSSAIPRTLNLSEAVVGHDSHSQEIAAKLTELCRKHDVPAMTAAVVNTGGLVSAACVGNRKRGTTDMVTLSDRFPLGSCTKSMTATLAAVLVETGKIDWTTTLGDVWPQATDDDLHPKLATVTLDQLLSHQSGLPENISEISGRAWASFFDEKISPPLERRRMLKVVLSQAPPRPLGKFAYSNLGYAIASAMLETRAGESFESLMMQHVFVPLEMHSADFRSLQSAQRLQPPLLWGHQAAGGEPVDPRTLGSENPSVYAGAGTVHVSIEDYTKYARWHLAGEASPVLRSQDAFDHLHEPRVDYVGGDKYGRGWICSNTEFGSALNHAGTNTNTFALIWVLPESDFAAVVCTNTGQPQAFRACDEMISYLMPQFASTTSDPALLTPDRLVGQYQLNPNFVFDVNFHDGQLMVGITNQQTQEVFADSPTRWTYRSVDAQLEFHLRAKGPAHALTLHQNGMAQKAKRVRQ